jgi:hypothetical protein
MANSNAKGQRVFITNLADLYGTSASSSTTTAATTVNSVAYENSRVLKASPGTLVSLTGYNSLASAQFIQLFNSTTVPADAAVPVAVITAAASSNFSFPLPDGGLPFSTGIAVSNSTTGPTKTIGAANCYFTAVVR